MLFTPRHARVPARYRRRFIQILQKRAYPNSALDGLKADLIDAGTPLVGPDQSPGVTEEVFPADLVVKCVKAIAWFLLGLGIQLPL
jgi:hypothetical protein